MGNLPVEASPLVGRRAELRQVARRVGRSRLMTVTGVGGVGKTRLALRTAATLQPLFADGAWWVELSPLRQGKLLPHTIAEALPLADHSTRRVIDMLADHLAGRQLLLVLDTCEHLVEECQMVTEALLHAAPGLRILATSRRPLNLLTEEVFTLEPLPLPAPAKREGGGVDPAGPVDPTGLEYRADPVGPADPADPVADGTAADGAEADALVLLADRAARAVPGFVLTPANRAELVTLCRRLEGLPLAIELAAARLRHLPLAELNRRLEEERYALLGETEHAVQDTIPPWHQALRTTIGWSHQLCTPAERLLWARLSVFAGSFDAEAAEQVCADTRLSAADIPGLLGSLVEKSILTWQPAEAGERYRMLDTLREYGGGWLSRLGEEDALHRRHRDHYLRLARAGDAAWFGPDQFAWCDRMTAEHGNLRAALEFCLSRPADHHTALELAGALWFFWYGCGFVTEGQYYLTRALTADTAPSRTRVRALFGCCMLLFQLGDRAGVEIWAAQCADQAGRFGEDEAATATATAVLLAILRSDYTELVTLSESLPVPRQRMDEVDYPIVMTMAASGHAYISTGRIERAVAVLDGLHAHCALHGECCLRSWIEINYAQAELALGRHLPAEVYARSALRVKHRLHEGVGRGMAIEVLAQATAGLGRNKHAAYLLGLAQQIWGTLGRPQLGIPAWEADRRACEQRARQALGAHAYQRAFDTGLHADLDTGVARALAGGEPGLPPALPGPEGAAPRT
ncbi:ATP-binding protein [Streptomyces sp. CA-132043]|uniref:ATP-binding protein n=1 Tax=Streptomyces sp. CA-132043 TaxID=3240048 RepID=UPI003D8F98CE